MDVASFKMVFVVALLVIASVVPFSRMPGAEARGPFTCPGMIDCSSVCQGYPFRCVNGVCICGQDQGPPPFETILDSNCGHDSDCKSHCPPNCYSKNCDEGKCICGCDD